VHRVQGLGVLRAFDTIFAPSGSWLGTGEEAVLVFDEPELHPATNAASTDAVTMTGPNRARRWTTSALVRVPPACFEINHVQPPEVRIDSVVYESNCRHSRRSMQHITRIRSIERQRHSTRTSASMSTGYSITQSHNLLRVAIVNFQAGMNIRWSADVLSCGGHSVAQIRNLGGRRHAGPELDEPRYGPTRR